MERSKPPETEKNPWGLPDIGMPAEVLFHPEISSTEKILFGFIRNLSWTEKGCWASNKWLGGCLGLKGQTISNAISNLKFWELINVEYLKLPDGREVRKIFINPEYSSIFQKMITEEGYNNINRGILKKLYPSIIKIITPYKKSLTKEDIKEDNKNKNNNTSSNNENPKQELKLLGPEKVVPNKEKEKSSKSKIDKVVKMYHRYCPSLPKIIKLTDKRKKTITARLKEYPLQVMKQVFQEAETSQFLSGKNKAWSGCNFDWLMNENNMIKVLEGNYKNEYTPMNTGSGDSTNNIKKLIEQQFPDEILRKSFLNNCCKPAKLLLHIDRPDDITMLVKTLLNLYTQIEQEQKKKLTKSLQSLLPGSLSLIKYYIDWINNQSWIDRCQIKMFDIRDGRFAAFRREQAKEDNQERDALTGKTYARE